ncbi:MAG: hypothetical protein J0L57_05570 [Burkholderiales bacterium]|nr:hypothetical protein [Burkholderiales bacterium]
MPSKAFSLAGAAILGSALLASTPPAPAQAPAEPAASAAADAGALENAFLWSLATPLITHAGNKAIDWLFDTVSARGKATKAQVAIAPSPGAADPAARPASAATQAQAAAPASVAAHTAAVKRSVGIAYRLYRVGPERNEVAAAPDEEFRNGDRIVVRFVTNLPGLMRVTNTDAQGRVQPLGYGFVQGARTARLGPFEFYGAPGLDVLALTLQPCRPDGAALPATLKLTYGDRAAAIDPGVLAALPGCSALAPAAAEPLESLRQVDERTAYALAAPGGKSGAQAVVSRIPLRHR